MEMVCLRDKSLFQYIISYQYGLQIDILYRFNERYKLQSIEKLNHIEYPITLRSIQCKNENNFLDLQKLCLNSIYCDRRYALHLAIADGEMDIIQHIVHYCPDLVTIQGIQCAIHFNQFLPLKYLSHYIPNLNDLNIQQAIDMNNIELVKFLFENGYNSEMKSYCGSIDHSIEMIHYLYIKEWRYFYDTYEFLFDINFDKLKILYQYYPDDFHSSEIIYHFCQCGHLNFVKFYFLIHENQISEVMLHNGYAGALSKKHFHIIKWLYNEIQILYDNWYDIFSCNNYKIIEWFINQYLLKNNNDINLIKKNFIFFNDYIGISELNTIKLIDFIGIDLNYFYPLTLNIGKYLNNKKINWNKNHFYLAIVKNNIELIKFYIDIHCTTNIIIQYIYLLIEKNFIDIILLLKNKNLIELNKNFYNILIRYGTIEMIEIFLPINIFKFDILIDILKFCTINKILFLWNNISKNIWCDVLLNIKKEIITFIPIDFIQYLILYQDYLEYNIIIEILFLPIQWNRIDIFNEIILHGILTRETFQDLILLMIKNGAIHSISIVWDKGVHLLEKNSILNFIMEMKKNANKNIIQFGPWTLLDTLEMKYRPD